MRRKFAGQWRVTGWQAGFVSCSEGFSTSNRSSPRGTIFSYTFALLDMRGHGTRIVHSPIVSSEKQ